MTSRLVRALPTLYGARSVATLVWIAAVLAARPTTHPPGPGSTLRVLLALYPAVDVMACLVDLQVDSTTLNRALHRVEATFGAATTAWLVLAPTWRGLSVGLGVWGASTGLIQVTVAARRIRRVPGQWLMVASGAGGVVGGVAFLQWQGTGHAFASLATQYATGGVLFYAAATTWAGVRTALGAGSLPAA